MKSRCVVNPDLSHGRDYVLALMFDMNLLWEKFVYVSLRKHLPADLIQSQSSKPYWQLDNHRPVRLKPDIVVTLGDRTFVIDTKWKILNNDRPSDDDLRQMYAYTKYWASVHTFLCYPGESQRLIGNFFHEETQQTRYGCSVIFVGFDPYQSIAIWQENLSLQIKRAIFESHVF